MQELVARYPELIMDGDGDLLLIRREQIIADGADAGGRWSLDHLFVTREGIPVLVELKRAVDTRLRREVVGQMLDYAANATAYWQAGRIAESFANTVSEAGGNPDGALLAFIGDRDPEVFWNQVDANFKAGNIKLVFVADRIPRELARIVEFLNEQMRADVRAIELRWFAGEDGTVTLGPRVFGETERAVANKRSSKALETLTLDEWIQRHVSPMGETTMAGARVFIRYVEEAGGEVLVSDQQGSIIARVRGDDGRAVYLMHLWPGKGGISLSLRWLHKRPALSKEADRQRMLDGLKDAVGTLTTENLKGFPSFQSSVLADPYIQDRFEVWLRNACEIARLAG
ncbi:hypothetical protein NDN16_01770 [Aureimonas altamirensis]|uniref:hypothetical protein n=1 Tax=Aureimonas altamirensis TaxID=370622 RepID=UPI0025538381|nr:hypothetical protein [Aureimonas altamirensis]MCM2502396.1 hypothetical protein [Aureimonas altamirensis]